MKITGDLPMTKTIKVNGWTVTVDAPKQDGPVKITIENKDHSLVLDKGGANQEDGYAWVEEYYTERQYNERKHQ
jgi:hypothetical protein